MEIEREGGREERRRRERERERGERWGRVMEKCVYEKGGGGGGGGGAQCPEIVWGKMLIFCRVNQRNKQKN